MKTNAFILFFLLATLASCQQTYEYKTVICIPVYGQSLALGEEAVRITDFDTLANYADGRIVTENLDHRFGYFDNNDLKKFAKKMTGYKRRAFELSVYSMAELLTDSLGKDTIVCIFPGGQGTTSIAYLGKDSKPYKEFLEDIETACKTAKNRGWNFLLPALCWMQGETDVTDYPGTDYRQLMLQFARNINDDIKRITGQKQDVEFICYQTNPVTRARKFNALAYKCPESVVPQTLLELVRDSATFHASGPTYPYGFVREAIHIDGQGQIQIGKLAALSVLDILRNRRQLRGLLPLSATFEGNEVVVAMNVPYPPLSIDTVQVATIAHYGFSVITPDNRDIAQTIRIQGDSIHIVCTEEPANCHVRYAINGENMKSGRQHGPRGNIRDSQGDVFSVNIQGEDHPIHNWCYQFDILVK